MWKYQLMHVPGKENHAADAGSRYPSDANPTCDGAVPDTLAAMRIHAGTDDDLQSCVAAPVKHATSALEAVTWDSVRDNTLNDADLQLLAQFIHSVFFAISRRRPGPVAALLAIPGRAFPKCILYSGQIRLG